MNIPVKPPKMMHRPPTMVRAPVQRFVKAGTTNSVAPVCPISRPEAPPAQPGIRLPVPVPAYDLPSAIAAINALVTVYNANTDKFANIRWVEKERTTQNVRIFNPNDNSQYVDVVRIVKLIMEDVITGELWWWELGGSVKQQLGIF
jgi:hypothetical protein